MLEFKTGDILHEDAEALVNTVNCVGIMGRGIALQFKKAFPKNFKEYELACDRREVVPGRMLVHSTGSLTNPRYIINFPTKRHWKGKSRIEDIEAGLVDLKRVIIANHIRSIAVPPLGAGLGGLDWSDVRSLIVEAMAMLDGVRVIVFEPNGAPEPAVMARNKNVPDLTPGRAALVGLMDRYLSGLMDPFITLLEVHKLMYFMQEVGQPLRLRYAKAPFGPYAENLRHVLNHIEGHLVSGYGDGGDSPSKRLTLVPAAAEEARTALEADPDTLERFERVARLVEGFETPFGLELLATVHWVATREGAQTPRQVVDATWAWNEHKRQFSARQIELAYAVLRANGFIADAAVTAQP